MEINVSLLQNELAPLVNAASASSDDYCFWTTDEMYQFADDAVKDLARRTMCFTAAPPAIATAAASPVVANPAGAIAIVSACFLSQPLRAATVPELEALDDRWDGNQATPQRFVEDVGLGSIRLYPAPPAAGMVDLVVQAFPEAITAARPTFEAPSPIAGYVLEAMLGRARGKQSDAMMPEVAAHCQERIAMYIQLCTEYWGAGE